MPEYNCELIFPTPLAVIKTDQYELSKKFADKIKNLMTPGDKARLKKFGWHTSHDNLHQLGEFEELYTLIDTEAKKFHEGVLQLKHEDLEMKNMWANIHINRSQHHIHQHPNSYFSGVFYLQIPVEPGADPGNIFFTDPRPAAAMQAGDFQDDSPLSYRSWWITPHTSLLLFFPSWLEHGTDPCSLSENTERISLSWNYQLKKCSTETMRI